MFVCILFTWVLGTIPDKCMESGVIALTFDDGPTAYTANVLDQLDELGVKATFHFTVQNIVRGGIANLMRRATEEGHTVGLRVNPTRDYDEMDAKSIDEDINGQVKVLQNESGEEIKFARAPAPDMIVNEDVYNALTKDGIIQTGYTYCFYHDSPDADEAITLFSKILDTSSPKYESFIILLHEEMEKSFPLLEDIVTLGKKNGYEFVTMEQCLGNYKPGEIVVPGGRKGSALSNQNGSSAFCIAPLCLLVLFFV